MVNPVFTFTYLEQTLGSCNIQENTDFELLYFSFYYSNQPNPFVYLIETDNDGNKRLTITSASGDHAIYDDHLLSNQDFYSLQFSIHPNPAKNELFLTSKSTTENLTIKILNIEGKLLSNQ
ncbi:MAG: T9SS type A sorting domain-containing protein, partial [Aequorivita sp.]|nr:T9SS type A sorting domain-containing protein [Aequorivita sp.]